jgi:natural product precursor
MKIKKFNKKLALNKETIAHLDHHQMKNAAGGAVTVTGPCTVMITGNPCEDICATLHCQTNPIDCTTVVGC